ncbi:hypothetical protein MPL3365_200131 [Mesorhizobium plurifarium]|uniref:Uncharacterized protein n=1 Tax=Mesorhizobium plurifarium TaxID=69974 RepID=A0A090G9X7_MESPL|nr:hypothetical protein MPL3365_200131 [Mesorhizobium plurifarium]
MRINPAASPLPVGQDVELEPFPMGALTREIAKVSVLCDKILLAVGLVARRGHASAGRSTKRSHGLLAGRAIISGLQ